MYCGRSGWSTTGQSGVHGLLGVKEGREFPVLHIDEPQGLLGVFTVSNDDGNGIPHKTHLLSWHRTCRSSIIIPLRCRGTPAPSAPARTPPRRPSRCRSSRFCMRVRARTPSRRASPERRSPLPKRISPFPVTFSRASTLITLFPISSVFSICIPSLCILARRRQHRLDDLGVTGATAEVPAEVFFDCLFGRAGVLVQEGLGSHDHPGSAVSALNGKVLDELFLQRVQFPRLSGADSLDGDDLLASCLHRRVDAASHGLPVDQHRAGAAIPGLTADLGARQTELLPQYLGQTPPRLGVEPLITPFTFSFRFVCFMILPFGSCRRFQTGESSQETL